MEINEMLNFAKSFKFCIFNGDLQGYLNKFEKYLNYLVEENSKFNLTAIREPGEIVVKHFYDSLLLLKFYDINNKNVMDVGSGAGFPGIPLAIMCPDSKFYLIEPTTKKANFLSEIVKILELKNVIVLNQRVEDLDKNYYAFFDVGVCRGVSTMNILAELILPFVHFHGTFIPYKGNNVEKELEEAKGAIKILSGKVINIYEDILPTENKEVRSFPIIEKIGNSPHRYPRSYSIICNKPLK